MWRLTYVAKALGLIGSEGSLYSAVTASPFTSKDTRGGRMRAIMTTRAATAVNKWWRCESFSHTCLNAVFDEVEWMRV
jgi:hypothetical protein